MGKTYARDTRDQPEDTQPAEPSEESDDDGQRKHGRRPDKNNRSQVGAVEDGGSIHDERPHKHTKVGRCIAIPATSKPMDQTFPSLP